MHHAIVDHRTDAAVTAERSAAGNSDLPSQRGLSSAAADLQHALIDRYGTAERVITGQQQGAGTTFGHGAETIEATTESPVQVLLKNQRGVVENVALQTGAITDQRTATDRGATAISIGTTQYQGAGIKLLDTARAHQRYADFRARTGIHPHRCEAAIRAVDRGQRAASSGYQAVTGREELHTGEVLIALNGDRAALPAEHGELPVGAECLSAAWISPVGTRPPHTTAATDAAIRIGGAAVPELHLTRRVLHQQIDLIGNGGLQGQVGLRNRQAAVDQTVVGQAAAVAEQLIDASAKTTGVADVQRAVEGQVAGDIDHRGRAGGRPEAEVQISPRRQRQRTDRQRRRRAATGQRRAVGQLQ